MSLIGDENVKLKRKSFEKVLRKTITNEKGLRSRILYAGGHPREENLMVLYRIIEMYRGCYYLEETVFNSPNKSFHTTVTSLSKSYFHKIIDPKLKLHDLEFNPNPQIYAATSYVRKLKDYQKVFHNTITKDYRSGGFFGLMDFYSAFWMRRYLNRNIRI
jgi:hypothetical protein